MDKELKEAIIKLHKKGMSLRAIGKILGVSHEYVRHHIPKNMRRPHNLDSNTIRKVVKTYKKCGSYQETADIVGLKHRETVRLIIAREL